MEVPTREELSLPWGSYVNGPDFIIGSKQEQLFIDTNYAGEGENRRQFAIHAANQYHAMREAIERKNKTLEKIAEKCSCDFSMSKAVHDDDCCKMIAQKALAGGVGE